MSPNRLFISIAVIFSSFAIPAYSAISAVTSEYKVAGQERQAEIARQTFCTEKAVKEKIMKRDLASFVVVCMNAIENAEQAIKK